MAERRGAPPAVPVILALLLALGGAGCRFVSASGTGGSQQHAILVHVTATPEGCAPTPKRVRAGLVEIVARNLNAPTVSEIEVRTANLAEVLGEKENLIEGLSAQFDATLTPGQYVVDCPGAAVGRWPLVALKSPSGTP